MTARGSRTSCSTASAAMVIVEHSSKKKKKKYIGALSPSPPRGPLALGSPLCPHLEVLEHKIFCQQGPRLPRIVGREEL